MRRKSRISFPESLKDKKENLEVLNIRGQKP